ncbi:Major facilitator-type transporter hxnZ [Metarhizium brunneum]|uniref:Major facilitator-type transporter hxnZ n=1 Tax=Metarhizium brunneum TaxID=500148 RepID=A0A7D5V1W3_9HYPO|nr:Major facilitator-type transporter hxnZ [Metarhizium brunneum]
MSIDKSSSLTDCASVQPSPPKSFSNGVRLETEKDNAVVVVQTPREAYKSPSAARQAVEARNIATTNHAIEQIGFGRYQWQLFMTCGFGFVMDQLIIVSLALTQPQVVKQWHVKYPAMIICAVYVGALLGSILCGFSVDIIGRRLVWQVSLIFVSIWTLDCAASPNFAVLAVFVGLQAGGGGGNFAIDLTVFIEALPKSKDYILAAIPLWWSLGGVVGCLIIWPLTVNFSCPQDSTPETCHSSQNMGWRYQYIAIGALSFIMASVRIFLLKMEESPKWLISQGRFDDAMTSLSRMAHVNKRATTITAGDFEPVVHLPARGKKCTLFSSLHVKGLFINKMQSYSTVTIIFLWICIGVAYPVFVLYLPAYLQHNGTNFGNGSIAQTYRDYVISATVGIFGPIFATYLVNVPFLGRRRSMALTALCAAAFCGGFTAVRTEAANIAFSSMISFWQSAFCGILYAWVNRLSFLLACNCCWIDKR